MESTFAFDFSKVRVHDDAMAADTNRRMGSNAYTLGSDIAFASDRYRPNTRAGRELLAHELTHVAQQRAYASVQLDDAEVTVNIPSVWNVYFKQGRPNPNNPRDMESEPSEVLTADGVVKLKLLDSLFLANPSLKAEVEGNASREGPPDFNKELSLARARYVMYRLGLGSVHGNPSRKHDCPEAGDGVYACGTSHAGPGVDPADRYTHVTLFVPPAPTAPKLGPPADDRGTGEHKQEATKPDATPKAPEKKPEPVDEKPTPAEPEKSKNQLSLGIGGGATLHRYLSTPGPKDPLAETLFTVAGAYTRQFHRDKAAGAELQVPLQLQYSLEAKKYTLSVGGQASYVVPFGDPTDPKWQFSAYVQALVGGDTTGGFQLSGSAGLQLTFQPKDWLQIGVQASPLGGTVQTSGPSSFDMSGLLFIQIQN